MHIATGNITRITEHEINTINNNNEFIQLYFFLCFMDLFKTLGSILKNEFIYLNNI